MAFLVVVGALQFAYVVLVGNFVRFDLFLIEHPKNMPEKGHFSIERIRIANLVLVL